MSGFDDREKAHENRYAREQELEFKAGARRNRLLGLWAAEKLGLAGDDAESYAKEVIAADFEEVGDEDVFRKVRKDFDAKGVAVSDIELRHEMTRLLDLARAQIQAE
ncbi:DUF1476 domain-containing protein [Glycocaulis abyssi]|uniref:DUF1476 domain-containing protein n=1 Tax=Glycocaulis abyssi TaxID=1433403 RepID=A0ABV9NC99_9PROT